MSTWTDIAGPGQRRVDHGRLAGRTGPASLDELLSLPSAQLARLDIGFRNLLCATNLPGSEDLDVPQYMTGLDVLAEGVRRRAERALPRFRADPGWFSFPRPISENFFRIVTLVTELKVAAGIHYNPERIEDNPAPLSSKDMFINGALSDDRIGTCNSIPVLIVAVGRRLGYPLFLAMTPAHVWARWDGQGERFNVEASCPGGFNDLTDDELRSTPAPMRPVDVRRGCFLTNLDAADETALFLFSRALVLIEHERFEDSLPAWAKCCFLSPQSPMYPRLAYRASYDILHVRKFGRPAARGPDGHPLKLHDFGDLRQWLSTRELGLYLSIQGHFHEVREEAREALHAYRHACQVDPAWPDHRADYERYLKGRSTQA